MFELSLICGLLSGSTALDTQMDNNGSAIFVVNNVGQRFHVTSEAYREMKAAGKIGSIEVVDQSIINGMPIGDSNKSAAQLQTIDKDRGPSGSLVNDWEKVAIAAAKASVDAEAKKAKELENPRLGGDSSGAGKIIPPCTLRLIQ